MRRIIRSLTLGVCLVGMLPACSQSDPNSTDYWVERLNTGERRQAIIKLGEMGRDKAHHDIAVEALMQAYKKGSDGYNIIAQLSELGDHKAIPVLLEAIKNTSDGKGGQLAATTLLDWKVSEHIDTYVSVIANSAAPKETRYGVLKLIAAFPNAKATPALLPILNGDPDLQPIHFNGLAAEALGKLKEPKAVEGLINCLWLDDHLHRNQVSACRLALNRIGPEAAVPLLIKTLERKNRPVEKRARKFKFHRGGLIEAKAAELLGDMPTAAAVEPLLKALKNFEQMPPSVQQNPAKSQAFVMGGVQKVISIANALAAIGDARAVEPLLEIAGDKELALEHKLTSVQQLAFLGNKKAIPGLMKLLKHDPSQYDPVSQGFRVQLALNIANLLDGQDKKAVDALDKQIASIIKEIKGWRAAAKERLTKQKEPKKQRAIKSDIKGYGEWLRNYAEVTSKIAAIRECTTDPVCWGKKLTQKKDIAVRMLAGYRLAQTSDARDTAIKELVKHVGDADMAVRNVVLFGLDRLGDHSIIPVLKKAREADVVRAKKDKRYRGAIYTLDLMIAKLSHKTKG